MGRITLIGKPIILFSTIGLAFIFGEEPRIPSKG